MRRVRGLLYDRCVAGVWFIMTAVGSVSYRNFKMSVMDFNNRIQVTKIQKIINLLKL